MDILRISLLETVKVKCKHTDTSNLYGVNLINKSIGFYGEVREWLNLSSWKGDAGKLAAGSNPVFSSINKHIFLFSFFYYFHYILRYSTFFQLHKKHYLLLLNKSENYLKDFILSPKGEIIFY